MLTHQPGVSVLESLASGPQPPEADSLAPTVLTRPNSVPPKFLRKRPLTMKAGWHLLSAGQDSGHSDEPDPSAIVSSPRCIVKEPALI